MLKTEYRGGGYLIVLNDKYINFPALDNNGEQALNHDGEYLDFVINI